MPNPLVGLQQQLHIRVFRQQAGEVGVLGQFRLQLRGHLLCQGVGFLLEALFCILPDSIVNRQ
ncbi:MAG: hypothetical protein HZT40_20040 [Candidatus Thiothrix singaporensis]|uniref:Uncharacterized protein n=1 Tax=Candidatus Thiothrix singaporensis TaxID=2799669 RepID=A0A7L6AWQ7_9GAMM|nr:MAG: hypothetical protein HZT40_20040 [Candidatus Thiothrix singaporensis]